MDGKSLERARRACLAALRKADRAGVEGLPLIDLFGYLNTRRHFKNFEVWGFKRILAVVRDCREVPTEMVENVIAALEWLASEGFVILSDADGETVILLTERGRTGE